MNRQQKYLIASLCYIILFSVMNNTMFNIALPTLSEAFALTYAQVSWAVISYGILFAVGSVTYGKLADLFPVRWLIVIGLGVFAAGSLIGFLSAHFIMVIIGRIVQGMGASAIPALAMLVAARYFPQEKRGQVFGYVASTVALGMGIGPIVGGAITEWLGWEWLFLFSIGSLLAIPFLLKFLPEDNGSGGKFDLPGALLFGSGAAFFLMGINLNVYLFLPAVACFAWFGRHIRRVEAPFVRIDLLSRRRYRLLLVLGFCIFCSIGSFFFVIPIMLEEVKGLDAADIGFVLFPGTMTAALFGSSAGKWSDRFGSPLILMIAGLLMMSGYLMLSLLGQGAVWMIALLLIAVYLGFSSLQFALGSYITTTLQKNETGVGTGLYNLINFIGGTTGPAWSSRFLDAGGWLPFGGGMFASYRGAFWIMAGLCMTALWMLYRSEKGGRRSRAKKQPQPHMKI